MIRKLTPGTFFGDKLKSCEVAGVHLSVWTYSAGLQLSSHSHERAFFNLTIDGSHTESCAGRRQECPPSTFAFHPAGEVHANQFPETGATVFDIEIEDRWVNRARERGERLDCRVEFPGGHPVWLASRVYREFHAMDSVSPLAIEGLVLELLAEVCRRPASAGERYPPRWLRQVRDLLHARFDETLSLHEIAREVGVHPDHLMHAFRQHYHCTVGDYVRRLRIDFACHQLISTDASLCEIALNAGFTDQSHFTRAFKHRMGTTPGRFRRDFGLQRSDTTR